MEGLDARDEIVAKHKILGRVPIDRQLREEQHVGMLSSAQSMAPAMRRSLPGIADTEIQLEPRRLEVAYPRYAPAYAVARDRQTAVAAIPLQKRAGLEFLVPDEGQRSSIADLVAMGADPAGAWPRLISMIEPPISSSPALPWSEHAPSPAPRAL